jgi:N-acetylglutamate synthase and related acetyltransferases
MEIRKASIDDIHKLVELRLDYFREDSGSITKEQEQAIRHQLFEYLPKHLAGGDFAAFLAEENNSIVSCAFLAVQEKPANLQFISGKTGLILNVLTYPEHRRKGYAFRVLTALIQEAKNLGLCQLELSATKDGKPLYEKLGFSIPVYTSMRLNLQ